MRITIDTEILKKENLSLADFLVLLIGFYDLSYKDSLDKLIRDGTIQPNLFQKDRIVLSNNTKDQVVRLLTASDAKVDNCSIDFIALAKKLQAIYPQGHKPNTTYDWRDDTEVIAHKLRVLVVKHDFIFTEEEALRATKEYVESFDDLQKMQLLRNFILRTNKDHTIDSTLMTFIENNR